MQVFVDNSSTTRIRQEVLDIMQANQDKYGNPSSIHSLGIKSKQLIEYSRKIIADCINSKPNEIIFTSGGTESNSLALIGFCEANKHKGCHIITSSIEHASILNSTKYLYNIGYDVTYLPVDGEGRINLQQLQNSIRRNTILISIMYANNEIGIIQPIKQIGNIARHNNIYFHTDAVSALGHCDINVDELNIDMMSISGHKFYAPKGVGALYVKDDIELFPLFYGSGQEYGLRSGTENVNSIIGMGKAIELLQNSDMQARQEYLRKMKNILIDRMTSKIDGIELNGDTHNGLNNIINFSIDGISGYELVLLLDKYGVYCSQGSASNDLKNKGSHVIRAVSDKKRAYEAVRFSLSHYNTIDEINYICDILPDLVNKLRN